LNITIEMEKRNQAILERKRQSEQRRKEKEEKLRVINNIKYNIKINKS